MSSQTNLRFHFMRALPGLVMLAIAIGFIVASSQYSAQAASMPRLAGAVTAILAVLDIIWPYRFMLWPDRNIAAASDGHAPSGEAPEAVWKSIAWLAGFIALILVLGFLPAIPIYIGIALVFQAGTRPLVAALVAAFAALFCWALFETVLGYHLYRGLLDGIY